MFGSMESFSVVEQLINQCEKMTLLMKAGTAAYQLPHPFKPKEMVAKGDIGIAWCSQKEPVIKALNFNLGLHNQLYRRQDINLDYKLRQWMQEK